MNSIIPSLAKDHSQPLITLTSDKKQEPLSSLSKHVLCLINSFGPPVDPGYVTVRGLTSEQAARFNETVLSIRDEERGPPCSPPRNKRAYAELTSHVEQASKRQTPLPETDYIAPISSRTRAASLASLKALPSPSRKLRKEPTSSVARFEADFHSPYNELDAPTCTLLAHSDLYQQQIELDEKAKWIAKLRDRSNGFDWV